MGFASDWEREANDRLTAPQRVRISSFRKHERVEGYHENKDAGQFVGSDRLLRLESLYGTVQLGYAPHRGQSFLFAGIKTSIYDNAAARWNRELKEYQAKHQLKGFNENTALNSRLGENSVVMVYKAENKPWSEYSLASYLGRSNMESLRKTMPFMDRSRERAGLKKAAEEKRRLEEQIRRGLLAGEWEQIASFRRQERELSANRDGWSALLYRKHTASHHFFRRVNLALDIQKHAMFAYYRARRKSLEEQPGYDHTAGPPEQEGDE